MGAAAHAARAHAPAETAAAAAATAAVAQVGRVAEVPPPTAAAIPATTNKTFSLRRTAGDLTRRPCKKSREKSRLFSCLECDFASVSDRLAQARFLSSR